MNDRPSAGRLTAPRRDDLPPAAREVYDAITTGDRARNGVPPTVADGEGRLQGPYNAMIQASPTVGLALQGLGAALRYHGALGDRAREIAILTISALRRCEFEWAVHVAAAQRIGISDDVLEAIARRDPGFFDAGDGLIHEATSELVERRDLTRSTWDRLSDAVGVGAAIDLVILVGYFDTMALMLRAFRVPNPASAE